MSANVRCATIDDCDTIAVVHQQCFSRQRDSVAWIHASLQAVPRFMVYVYEQDGAIVGYIMWAQKSGIRDQAVLELDQVGVDPAHQGQRIGTELIRESLRMVRQTLLQNQQAVKSVLVSTRADNEAQQLYRVLLGAEVVATIEGMYSADEVLMLARLDA